jgi:ABC-2 type transport system permease protein
MPIFFLSGALFPLTNLPIGLKVLTSIDPLSYGIDGLRNALTSAVHFGFVLDTIVLAVAASLFLVLSTYCFSRIEI